MTFGERLKLSMDHVKWDASRLSTESKVARPTILALVRRSSDRSDYKDDLVAAFPPDKINHTWLRSGLGFMTGVIEPVENVIRMPLESQGITQEALALARFFDTIPESDQSRRKLAFVVASDAISDVRRGRLVDLPIDMPDQAQTQEKTIAKAQ